MEIAAGSRIKDQVAVLGTFRMDPHLHSRCILCSNEHPVKMPEYDIAGLLQCSVCRFVFCEKIPTVTELIAHYNTYPRNDSISPITIRRYEELVSQMEKRLSGRNWLDVGCGNGHLLAVAAKLGWNVSGTEYTDDAVAICKKKNISMMQGPLDIQNYSAESFDVISFIEVIEHINTPHEEIEKFYHLLKKGGILYITTPNFNSLSRYRLKSNWNIIEYPEHLCYYTSSTLDKLLIKHGFEKISLRSSGYNPARKGGYIEGVTEAIKAREENLRERTENNALLGAAKKSVNFLLNTFKAGDTLKAVYRKK